MAHVAVVGNLSRDVVDGGAPAPGGCPFFAAEAFRRLGGDGQIVTRFADRDRDLFQPVIDTLGVPVTLLPAATTTGFTMDYDGEQRAMGVTAVGEVWQPEDAHALEDDIAWVHVAPLLRGDFPPVVIETFARGRQLSLDGQGLVRSRRPGPLFRDADYPPSVLSCVTALKLSEQEARVVAGGVFGRASAAALGVPEIVVTFGSYGVLVFTAGEETLVRAQPVDGVHTTGAGDTFMVGYATARTEGCEPVEAAEHACALVTRILEHRRLASP